MSTPTKCKLECEAGFYCIITEGSVQQCVPRCPAESNIQPITELCACFKDGSTVTKQGVPNKFCILGNPSDYKQCEDNKVTGDDCFCGRFFARGCSVDQICYQAQCYKSECSTEIYQGSPCKCGDSYVETNGYCKDGVDYPACEYDKITSDCGCGSDPGEICSEELNICSKQFSPPPASYTFDKCVATVQCIEGEVVPSGTTCACCDDQQQNCNACTFGNKCVDGVCKCRTTLEAPHNISSTCQCGTETCEKGQFCHNDTCYDHIFNLWTKYDVDMICRSADFDENWHFEVVKAGKYCTFSGKQSDFMQCSMNNPSNDTCICSYSDLTQCEVKIDGPLEEQKACLAIDNLNDPQYVCLSMCMPGFTPVIERCSCSSGKSVANPGDLCVKQNDGTISKHDPCNWSYFGMNGGDSCYCGAIDPTNLRLCSSFSYCGIDKAECIEPARCSAGIVKEEACKLSSQLCQRGNSVVGKECICAVSEAIVAHGSRCICGNEGKECGIGLNNSVFYCIENECVPNCSGGGKTDDFDCVCTVNNIPSVLKRTNNAACTHTCSDGFYLDEKLQYCHACDSTCARCEKDVCLTCTNSSWELKGTACVQKSNKWAIVGGVLGAIVVVVAAVVIAVVIVRRNKKSNVVKADFNEMRPAGGAQEPHIAL